MDGRLVSIGRLAVDVCSVGLAVSDTITGIRVDAGVGRRVQKQHSMVWYGMVWYE